MTDDRDSRAPEDTSSPREPEREPDLAEITAADEFLRKHGVTPRFDALGRFAEYVRVRRAFLQHEADLERAQRHADDQSPETG